MVKRFTLPCSIIKSLLRPVKSCHLATALAWEILTTTAAGTCGTLIGYGDALREATSRMLRSSADAVDANDVTPFCAEFNSGSHSVKSSGARCVSARIETRPAKTSAVELSFKESRF